MTLPRLAAMPALLVALLAAGCWHEPAPASAYASDAPPALLLRQADPADKAVYPGLWRALAALEGEQAAALALLTLASRQDDDSLRDQPGARRLAIEAVARVVQSGTLGKHFEVLRGVVDRLYRLAPTAPETRFALAYLRWILLSDGEGGLRRGSVDRAVLLDLDGQLEALTRDHPDFDGPGDFDAARLRRERDAVRVLLAAEATATTP